MSVTIKMIGGKCGCAGCRLGMFSPNLPRSAWMGVSGQNGHPFHRSNKPSHRHNHKGGGKK